MSDREDSPDWLRAFQAPAAITLSSDSESSLDDKHLSDDEDGINLSKLFQKDKTSLSEAKSSEDGHESQLTKMCEVNSPIKKVDRTPTRKRKKENQSEKEGKSTDKGSAKRKALEKPFTDKESGHPVCALSSDSESSHDGSSIKAEEVLDKDLLMHDAKAIKQEENDELSKKKSPKKKAKKGEQEKKVKLENQVNEEKEDLDAVEENIPEKQSGQNLSSSRLPLVLPEKVQRTKALVECEGDSIDLSGDVGAVGRIIVSDGPSGNHEMLLDLKGTIYKTTILPSRTFCVVSFGPSEGKVEAIMNDFIQLKSHSNLYDAETMVEGTLDGFTFDSDEEADNLPRQASQGDQNENVDNQTNGNVKAKTKKASAMEQKKGKKGAKTPKKVQKKPQAQKKSKSKK
ncbi:DNA-binding protein BIN4 [Capsicum annuum]|uniref:DNA-binding protein BIN4 n=1 Tax=Capsicum annuum TaxID=4072 RepID=A0A1U8FZC9_CAPAN|nr:DNA-binding protein BIN4 [Capsicum annuum]XP_016564195.1 DNA-binding protein BIN4 [Capsicum annuum]KAF3678310.1 DNA-binding protein BIN4 [Capsicum annuum]KAF3685357.1 DNA-binding protein BIN4 [Capsicum annuum]PHT87640.1 DNA-binding protein BIN4 [Capsicum annuum]